MCTLLYEMIKILTVGKMGEEADFLMTVGFGKEVKRGLQFPDFWSCLVGNLKE